jgi:hypothetical protein
MKISWTSLKISIAGARLSHLVQKDKIWDHGSMAEQVRIIFTLAQRGLSSGNIEPLKKQSTFTCYQQLKTNISNPTKYLVNNPVINEIVIVEVSPAKNNKPDSFAAIVKGVSQEPIADNMKEFLAQCAFVRQGGWWLLDGLRIKFYKTTSS